MFAINGRKGNRVHVNEFDTTSLSSSGEGERGDVVPVCASESAIFPPQTTQSLLRIQSSKPSSHNTSLQNAGVSSCSSLIKTTKRYKSPSLTCCVTSAYPRL